MPLVVMLAEMSSRIGSVPVGMPGGDRIRRVHGRHGAEGGDAREQRIGAADHRHAPGGGDAREICREAGDVVRAADGDRAGAAFIGHRAGGVERAQREPGSGQAVAFPQLRRRAAIHHRRRTIFAHRPAFQFGEIGGEQREPVRRVAHEIAGDQNFGDVASDVGSHSGGAEQGRREEIEFRYVKSRQWRGRLIHREWGRRVALGAALHHSTSHRNALFAWRKAATVGAS